MDTNIVPKHRPFPEQVKHTLDTNPGARWHYQGSTNYPFDYVWTVQHPETKEVLLTFTERMTF